MIRIGREIQCLPYAGFFSTFSVLFTLGWVSHRVAMSVCLFVYIYIYKYIYRSYDPLWSRESVSPVCGIFSRKVHKDTTLCKSNF